MPWEGRPGLLSRRSPLKCQASIDSLGYSVVTQITDSRDYLSEILSRLPRVKSN